MKITNRFMRFASVGILNTLIDATLFAILHVGGIDVAVANFISSFAGLLVSLLLNSRYTFGVGRLTLRQVTLFIGINLFGLWILQPLAIVALLYGFHHVPITASLAQKMASDNFTISFLASLGATVSTFAWNYLLYSRFVYVTKETKTST
jgi:putative flippase GtrA